MHNFVPTPCGPREPSGKPEVIAVGFRDISQGDPNGHPLDILRWSMGVPVSIRDRAITVSFAAGA